MKNQIICLAVVVVGLGLSGCGRDSSTEIPYNPDFVRLVEGGKVSHVQITEETSGKTYIRGECTAGASDVPGKVKANISGETSSVETLLRQHKVAFQIQPSNPIVWQSLTGLFPLLLFLVWLAVVIFVLTLAVRLVRAVEQIARNTQK